MDDEMIERVADAITERRTCRAYSSIELAMAAIKAMREPTKSMLVLGEEVGCWPEVIDHIINE